MPKLELTLQPKQRELLKELKYGKHPVIGCGGGRGSGKALHIDTPLATPTGWTTMGKIQVGDYVFGKDGEPAKVVWKSDLMYNKSAALTFEDGNSIICDLNHQWVTRSKRNRKECSRHTESFRSLRRSNRPSRAKGVCLGYKKKEIGACKSSPFPYDQIVTTQEIHNTITVQGGREVNWSIDLAQPLYLPDISLPLDPYTLGVWLGDGSKSSGIITSADPEIFNHIPFKVNKTKSKYAYRLVVLTNILSKMGVINNKHIPTSYLRSSYKQRLELLQGLMDTDGTVGSPAVTFTNTNFLLASGVYELAVSLGCKPTIIESRATLYGKDCGPVWDVSWTSNLTVFKLSRKLDVMNKRKANRRPTQNHRFIKSSRLIGEQPVQCIQVDNESHEYLAGNGMIPTHNSSGLDRCLITLMAESNKLLACCIMRNFDQVTRYHIQAIKRDFPYLATNMKISMPASLTLGNSQLDFSYAENLDDVKRRFQSGNYDLVVIDQAEQFTAEEIREIRKATRSREGRMAKIVLSFNMRGAGVQELRKWFYLGEFNKDEDPNDYIFFKFNPWDNVEYVKASLIEDSYTIKEYYSWTDEQRKKYASTRGYYTKQLATDDEVIRQSDWEGSWDSIEGTYYANSWDLASTRISSAQVKSMDKPWANHWISQDWGKAHYCATYWHYRVTLSPEETLMYLGWSVPNPINVIVTYREMLLTEKESTEVAQFIADSTPTDERPKHRAFYLGPDAFSDRDSPNTIAIQESKVLRANGLPPAQEANNARKSGASLIGKLLKATRGHGFIRDMNSRLVPTEDVWLISSECVELLKAIPMLMRDPKDLDDILKTDKSSTKIEQDCYDAARYGIVSMLTPKKKTEEQKFQEQMSKADPYQRNMLTFKHTKNKEKSKSKYHQHLPPSWKNNIAK